MTANDSSSINEAVFKRLYVEAKRTASKLENSVRKAAALEKISEDNQRKEEIPTGSIDDKINYNMHAYSKAITALVCYIEDSNIDIRTIIDKVPTPDTSVSYDHQMYLKIGDFKPNNICKLLFVLANGDRILSDYQIMALKYDDNESRVKFPIQQNYRSEDKRSYLMITIYSNISKDKARRGRSTDVEETISLQNIDGRLMVIYSNGQIGQPLYKEEKQFDQKLSKKVRRYVKDGFDSIKTGRLEKSFNYEVIINN